MSEIKRSDKQYVEIEEFADYELTQCIAYEMAIRDYHYRELADSAVAFYDDSKESIDRYLQENDNNFNFEQYTKDSDTFTYLCNLVIEIDMVQSVYGYILEIEEQYKDNRLGGRFWDIVEILGSMTIPNERILEQGIGTLIHQKDTDEIQLIKHHVRDGYSVDIALVTNDDESYVPEDEESFSGDGSEIESIGDYAKYIKEEGLSASRAYIRIEENFKRPLIKVDELKTISPELTVNLNRPLKEIIALITHIKKDTDENKLVISPIELLGESLEVSDAQPLRKKLADKFFVYDYVKARLEQIEKFNDETKKTFSEEVQQIKDNDNFSDEYKKYLINNAKEELKDGLYSTNINEIFDDEELKSVVSQGTAKRYYYEMKSYIEDKKYKELITGTHT